MNLIRKMWSEIMFQIYLKHAAAMSFDQLVRSRNYRVLSPSRAYPTLHYIDSM